LAFPDYVAAVFSAVGILAALEHRDRTGEGQFLETAQLEATAHLLGVAYMDYTVNGRAPQPQGNFSETKAPHDVYPCLDEDTWCAIEAGTEKQWEALVKVMGNPSWASDERFATLALRVEHKVVLDRQIAEWTCRFTPRQVMHTLQKAGVPAGIVSTGEDLFFDPQLRARSGAIVSIEHPGYGRIEHQGVNAHLSETPGTAAGPSPAKGQDNAYVFRQILGLSDTEINELSEAGALR
ncbi:MAG: CoA transferase, partial [Chloroflexi bacterium]|nr:CoA transferase [Chloroflexota bacterium]